MNDDKLIVWTVYDLGMPPYPNNYIAWKFSVANGKVTRTEEHMIAPHLEMIQRELQRRGLVKLMPTKEDDPSIIETWL